MGNLLNLNITKDQQKILSETFDVFVYKLGGKIRMLWSDNSVPKASTLSWFYSGSCSLFMGKGILKVISHKQKTT